MPLPLNPDWNEQRLTLGPRECDAYVRESGSLTDEFSFKQQHLRRVIDEGGLLFQQIGQPRNVREVANPGGTIGYQYDLPETHMWYLPQCSFEESLILLDAFGFPSEKICQRAEEVRALTKNLLRSLSSVRRIAPTAVASEAISVDSVDKAPPFTLAEITGVLEFNELHFGIRYTKAEFADLRRPYRREGFFVVGNV